MGAAPRSLHCNVLGTAVILAALACALAGCASTFGDLPPSLGGLPEGAPARPAAAPAYPAVHDMPPQRTTTIMTDEELKQAQAELIAARERQASPAPAPRKPAPKKRPTGADQDAGAPRNP